MATSGLKHFSGQVIEEKFLTCSICLEKFNNPKLLPCLHTFCLKCLEDHANRAAVNGVFPCPCCRTRTEVPSNTGTGFKTNFFMNSLLDFFANAGADYKCSFCSTMAKSEKAVSKCINCSDYLCEKCTQVHGMTRQTIKHKVIPLDKLQQSGLDEDASATAGFPCSDHPQENVRYYCTVCEKPVCRDCKALDHHQHQCMAFKEAAKELKPKMKDSLGFLKDELEKAENEKLFWERNLTKGQERCEFYTQLVEKTYEEVIRPLSDLKADGIRKLREQHSAFQKGVEIAQMRFTQIQSFQEYLTNVLNVGADVEVLETYSLAKKQNLLPLECNRFQPLAQEAQAFPHRQRANDRRYKQNVSASTGPTFGSPSTQIASTRFTSGSPSIQTLQAVSDRVFHQFASTVYQTMTSFLSSSSATLKAAIEELQWDIQNH